MPSSAKAKKAKKKKPSTPDAFATDLVYILNYAAGQDALNDVHEHQQWAWLDHDTNPLIGGQLAAAMDAPIDYDPDAWQAIDSEAGMLACRDLLRPMIDAWLEAGSNIDKWSGVGELAKALKQLSVRLFKADDGRAGFRLVKPQESTGNAAETWATEYMFRYITSPLYARVGRCARCKRYFFKKTRRGNHKFCSGKCARGFHAVKQRKAGREEVRLAKLERVRKAIKKFHRLSATKKADIAAAKLGIKRWLAESPGTYVATAFITRAVRLGDLDLGELGG